MTEPDFDQALATLRQAFGEPVHQLRRMRCPRCSRWIIRSPYSATVPCVLCTDTGEGFTYADLLIMVEYHLSWNAYQARLERDGPPWHNPLAWAHSKARQAEWQRRHGTGRRRDDDGDGGRG